MSETEYAEDGIQTYDTERIIDGVTELLQDRVDWHGWRTRAETARYFNDGGVVWTHRGGEIACTAVFSHLEQRPHTRVYFTALAESHWDPGLWESLIERIVRDSPYNRILSKTVASSEENELWRRVGHKVGEEPGKQRQLNVWLVDETDYSDIREW